MEKTEKRTAEEIPSSLIELLHAHSINTEFVAAANKMYVTSAPLPYFEAACKMYAAQELDAYKARLKEVRNQAIQDCIEKVNDFKSISDPVITFVFTTITKALEQLKINHESSTTKRTN